MWTDSHRITIGIDFTIKEVEEYLTKLGYQIMSVSYEEEFENEVITCIYLIPMVSGQYLTCFTQENLDNDSWRKNNLNHPSDAIRLIFEYEMKKKLLT